MYGNTVDTAATLANGGEWEKKSLLFALLGTVHGTPHLGAGYCQAFLYAQTKVSTLQCMATSHAQTTYSTCPCINNTARFHVQTTYAKTTYGMLPCTNNIKAVTYALHIHFHLLSLHVDPFSPLTLSFVGGYWLMMMEIT